MRLMALRAFNCGFLQAIDDACLSDAIDYELVY